jgi:hypothetical protein
VLGVAWYCIRGHVVPEMDGRHMHISEVLRRHSASADSVRGLIKRSER